MQNHNGVEVASGGAESDSEVGLGDVVELEEVLFLGLVFGVVEDQVMVVEVEGKGVIGVSDVESAQNQVDVVQFGPPLSRLLSD